MGMPAGRCTAKTKSGKRCSRRASKGKRCKMHPPQKPGPKGKRGRPQIVWDEEKWRMFDAMCSCGALEVDIAEAIQCDVKTLSAVCRRKEGLNFSQYRTKKKARGRVSLQAKQLEMAMNGSVAMCIWLGKQWLGQREPSTKFDVPGVGDAAVTGITVRFAPSPADEKDEGSE